MQTSLIVFSSPCPWKSSSKPHPRLGFQHIYAAIYVPRHGSSAALVMVPWREPSTSGWGAAHPLNSVLSGSLCTYKKEIYVIFSDEYTGKQAVTAVKKIAISLEK